MSMVEKHTAFPCYLPLTELLELLRHQGFSFGIDTYETAHYVIMKAIDSGDLEHLDLWLCPVLAHSATQQATFFELYERLFIPLFAPRPEPRANKKEITLATPLPSASEQTILTESVPLAPTSVAEEKKVKALNRNSRNRGSHIIDVFVKATEIVKDHTLLKVVRQFRYTELSGRFSFNIEKTIKKTIFDGGFARPVYTHSRRHIEYLMLIDRHNSRDHLAQLHNNLYETLKANNIFVERFYFDNSPLLCRNLRHPGGIALSEILSLYEHAALMIFTDGLQFLDTYRSKLFAWSDIFKQWQHRYFFSSDPPALWGKRERLLEKIFPFVLPLSIEGMQVMMSDLSQTAVPDCDWIKYWQDSADYSLVPVRTEGKKLDYIGLFFTNQMKRWIAACAVYPELNWNLTLALGKMLGELYPGESGTLHSYKNISQLLRLEWFIKGYIPESFRVHVMLHWLNDKEHLQIRKFIFGQINQNQPFPGEPDYQRRRLQIDISELFIESNEEEHQLKAEQLSQTLKQQTRGTDFVSLHILNERDNCRSFFEVPDDELQRWGIDPAQTRRVRKVPPYFVRIPEGEFVMGSPEAEFDRTIDETQHNVKLSEYYLCKYTVTFTEFKAFIESSGYRTDAEKAGSSRIFDGNEWKDKEGVNWRHGVSGNGRAEEEYNHPVVHVSWNDASEYCKWRSKTGKTFRLPTEAEWEYACRAGTPTPFHTGNNLTTEQANYNGNYSYNGAHKGIYRRNTLPVSSFEPNPWGLYNMHGNVLEWCQDRYDDKYYDECKAKGTVENPEGTKGRDRIYRGSSWSGDARGSRSAHRGRNAPSLRNCYVGFRVVFIP